MGGGRGQQPLGLTRQPTPQGAPIERPLGEWAEGQVGSAAVGRKGDMTKSGATKKKDVLRKLRDGLLRTLVTLAIPAQIAAPFLLTGSGTQFLRSHLTYLLAPLLLLLAALFYGYANHARTHPPKDKRGKPRRQAKPPRLALKRVMGNTIDIIANLDHIPWRIIYLLGFAASIVVPIVVPISSAQLQAVSETVKPVAISAGVPVAFALLVLIRIAAIMRGRMEWIEEMYAIARDCFGYKPLSERGTPTKRQRITATPHLAISVLRWKNLTEGDRAFVWVPEKLSVADQETWDSFERNLEEKMPREEGWHIQTEGKRGRGAEIGPANYPVTLLWDGECDPEPLVFLVGADLDMPGEWMRFTFGDVSPHLGIAGATGSGKTSIAEIICAQAAIKPMPWSQTEDPLYARVHIIDPKGPLANRWENRPGVTVSNGVKDIVTDEGEEVDGIIAMTRHMESIWERVQERSQWLNQFPGAANWLDIDQQTLAKERVVPEYIILDEFLDHTVDDINEEHDAAKKRVVYITNEIARKGRAVGVHLMVSAQNINMQDMGGTLTRQLVARVFMGKANDANILSRMFGTKNPIPALPTHRYVDGKMKGIPGRGFIMNAAGQKVHRVQAAWFGNGEAVKNQRTLDKWLPREEAASGEEDAERITAPTSPDQTEQSREPAIPDLDGTPEAPPKETDESPSAPPWGPEPDTAPSPQQPDIFPAATTSTDGCPDCGQNTTWSCPECDTRYCTDHGGRTRNPDPDASGRFVCADCAAQNPITQSGLGAILTELVTKTRRYRLHHAVTTHRDDGGHHGAILVRGHENGPKIVEIGATRPTPATPDEQVAYWARSSSGTVNGLAATQDRADTAIATFVRSRQEVTTAGGDQ